MSRERTPYILHLNVEKLTLVMKKLKLVQVPQTPMTNESTRKNTNYNKLEAPAPYGSHQGGHVIIFMPILIQWVPGLHTQKMVAIGSAVLAVPGNRQTDDEL